MSADEFDPAIERLFAQTPRLADEALFLATLQARLEKRSRWRALTLTAAGLVGGGLAVREGVNFNFTADGDTTLTQGLHAATVLYSVRQRGLFSAADAAIEEVEVEHSCFGTGTNLSHGSWRRWP